MFTRKREKQDQAEYEITKTEDEWKAELSPARYAVLRRAGTEPAWSGELLHVEGDGVFRCAGCDAALFDADAKFESGTGWPSFDRATAAGTIVEHRDRKFGMVRTEIRLRPLRRPPRARVPRRADRHRVALLRQFPVTDLRAGARRHPVVARQGCRQPSFDDVEDLAQVRRLVVAAQTTEEGLAESERTADVEDIVLQEIDARPEVRRTRPRPKRAPTR